MYIILRRFKERNLKNAFALEFRKGFKKTKNLSFEPYSTKTLAELPPNCSKWSNIKGQNMCRRPNRNKEPHFGPKPCLSCSTVNHTIGWSRIAVGLPLRALHLRRTPSDGLCHRRNRFLRRRNYHRTAAGSPIIRRHTL